MTLSEIAAVVDGEVASDVPGAGEVEVTGAPFLDSREVVPGGLFAAFAGEQVDGHRFAEAAVSAGAAAVLGGHPVGVPAVVVDDVREALQRLAQHLLERLPDLTVVGLTGSQGKTSTKDLLAAVLPAGGSTVATAGSFNNELGLPLTVLRADEQTRFLVLEMGARGIGHIAELCRIARPDVSLVLNVGKAHLGEFGTQQDIATAKGELVEALRRDGLAVLNADDPLVSAMAARTSAPVLTFGRGPSAAVRLTDLEVGRDGRPAFTLTYDGRSARVHLRVLGAHMADNAAAAAAVALGLGLDLDAVAERLAEVSGLSRWRMELHERADGSCVLNDSYNANPDSMAAALRALVSLAEGREGRSVAVLGEMRELGESSEAEHRAVGRLAGELGVARVVGVGPAAAAIVEGARETSEEEPVQVQDNTAAVAWLREHVEPGDVVLVKASRGARLDEVADALLGGVS